MFKLLYMRITNVFSSSGLTGFYFDDLQAIKKGAKMDGGIYHGSPVTQGFSKIRQLGESVSILIELNDGQIAYGDCVAVQYSGTTGRDSPFIADELIQMIQNVVAPKLIGVDLIDFKRLSEEIDLLEVSGKKLHSAIRYGASQAILDAFAKAQRRTMAEVIADAYGLRVSRVMVPLFAQSGAERYANVDKMILKGVKVLPHGLINSSELVGFRGEKLLDYVKWVRNRILNVGGVNYEATILLGVYGTIAKVFDNDVEAISKYICSLEKAADPFDLWIETPLLAESKRLQIELSKSLIMQLKNLGSRVKLVANEWCTSLKDVMAFCDEGATDIINIMTPQLGGINNSIEAVLYCRNSGIGAYVAGSCNETDKSARVSTHIALATQADLIAAKPGMGVDEGIMIVYNEMQRALAIIASRRG